MDRERGGGKKLKKKQGGVRRDREGGKAGWGDAEKEEGRGETGKEGCDGEQQHKGKGEFMETERGGKKSRKTSLVSPNGV